MEDIERYGDYNEIDEAPGGKKNPVFLLLKILVIVACFSVVGLLAFRVILFNYYPEAIKNIHYNEALTEHRELVGDDFYAKTQSLRAPYDDPDVATFIADNLIVIEAVGQLQISVRYNSVIFDDIKAKYPSAELDPDADNFTFELERVPQGEEDESYKIGELDYAGSEDFLIYTYYKLVFDGISEEHFGDGSWLRLKISLKDVPNAEPYYILVYENTDEYHSFTEYDGK